MPNVDRTRTKAVLRRRTKDVAAARRSVIDEYLHDRDVQDGGQIVVVTAHPSRGHGSVQRQIDRIVIMLVQRLE